MYGTMNLKYINKKFRIFNSPWVAQMGRKFPHMQKNYHSILLFYIIRDKDWSQCKWGCVTLNKLHIA